MTADVEKIAIALPPRCWAMVNQLIGAGLRIHTYDEWNEALIRALGRKDADEWMAMMKVIAKDPRIVAAYQELKNEVLEEIRDFEAQQ